MFNRKRLFWTAALILTLLITQAAYALFRESDINYYYEDAFLDWRGEEILDCDSFYTLYGSVGSFRVWYQYRCIDGVRVWHKCQVTDGMVGWITVGCPPNQP